MPETFTTLEASILRACCTRDPDAATALKQLESARFVKRERTGHGLFVHFEVDENVLPVKQANGRILLGSEKMFLKHPNLAHGGDAIVWLKDGVMDCLETYVFGVEPWPDQEEDLFVIEEMSE